MTTEIFTYLDRMDYEPGDRVRVFASSSVPQRATVSLVQPFAEGETTALEFRHEPVASVPEQAVDLDFQDTVNGSFGHADGVQLPAGEHLLAAAIIWPTLLGREPQPILTWLAANGASLRLGADADGRLTADVERADGSGAGSGSCTIDTPLIERQWYVVAAFADGERLTVRQIPIRSTDPADVVSEKSVEIAAARELLGASGTVLVGAASTTQAPNGDVRSALTFNGKIESPLLAVVGRPLGELMAELDAAAADRSTGPLSTAIEDLQRTAAAAWSFASDFASDRGRQLVAGQPELALVGAPSRGMTGHDWTGEHLDFRYAPEQYGAIHFHQDDLEDAAWRPSVEIVLPSELPSGIYAVHIVGADGGEDHAPVFVRRAEGTAPKDVLFLAPTFSYIAYANSRLAEELDYESGDLSDLVVTESLRDQQVYGHPEFGMSLYDHHVDGSGNCLSSTLRPIPNMRWDFRSALQSAPRHFAADIAWPAWFESQGIAADVLSDHGLQESGAAALEGYRLVITGSHPEYWSGKMLDAVEAYLDAGGSLAYVGGNGFYWVTSASDDRPHLLEVRRGQQGIRTWEGEPGEGVSTQTAEPGGLWRLRGRAPNRLVGVGMAAQGWDLRTPGFERTEASRDPRVASLFAGIDEEVIGDFGLVLNGAAGDEIDRMDFALGTPRHAITVARSQPHSKYYLAAPEELNTPTPNINGTNNPNVHADIVFHERAGGGFVVSTSAITWTGSLAYNRFDNNVSRFMRNVVDLALGG